VRSYERLGWAHHIRGPTGGGRCEGLATYVESDRGCLAVRPSVEIAIPNHRELQFASNGFIPLIHDKSKGDAATFFSCQSVKKPRTFGEDLNTKNVHLATNLAYTFSITRLAHLAKRMMRDSVGSAADGPRIQELFAAWLGQSKRLVSWL
jgi:type VI secretion system protein ImpC